MRMDAIKLIAVIFDKIYFTILTMVFSLSVCLFLIDCKYRYNAIIIIASCSECAIMCCGRFLCLLLACSPLPVTMYYHLSLLDSCVGMSCRATIINGQIWFIE